MRHINKLARKDHCGGGLCKLSEFKRIYVALIISSRKMSDFKIKSRNPIPDFGHTRIDIESPTPCKRQKLDIKPKVIAVRFTPLSLFLLIQKNENLLSNDGLWKRITHIFFDALMYSGNDKIVFGCSQFQQREKFTLSPETYFAVLD